LSRLSSRAVDYCTLAPYTAIGNYLTHRTRLFSYLIRNRIKEDDQHQGINPAWWVQHQSYAKANSPTSELCVANEWVAGHLANFLRLPVPPFALFRATGHPRKMFASLRFGERDTPPNDCRPLQCIAADRRLCTGIIVFDIFIANGDRHRENIKVDDPIHPQEFSLIDHERALLGPKKGDQAIQRLLRLWDELGIDNHCLAPHLDTAEHIEHWTQMVRFIPWPTLRALCDEATELGATKPLADKLYEFLEHRHRNLPEIIKQHTSFFPHISDWPSK
jgi:hypothetical protein